MTEAEVTAEAEMTLQAEVTEAEAEMTEMMAEAEAETETRDGGARPSRAAAPLPGQQNEARMARDELGRSRRVKEEAEQAGAERASDRARRHEEARRAAEERDLAERLVVGYKEDTGGRAFGDLLEAAVENARGHKELTPAERRSLRALLVLPEHERRGRLIGLSDTVSSIKKEVLRRFNAHRLRLNKRQRNACAVHKLLPQKYTTCKGDVPSKIFKPAAVTAAMGAIGWDDDPASVDYVRRITANPPTLRASSNAWPIKLDTLEFVDTPTLLALMGFSRLDTPTAKYLLTLDPKDALKLLGASQSLFSLKVRARGRGARRPPRRHPEVEL